MGGETSNGISAREGALSKRAVKTLEMACGLGRGRDSAKVFRTRTEAQTSKMLRAPRCVAAEGFHKIESTEIGLMRQGRR
ncbi:hypothetical protein NDU88_003277 [Pleurodeles waltl]|uniref:Uncharacterized protein n=1 Tax=Pleurodeles waltl TaxID=8319 RepID=A0AAV7QEH3_PLEWA|nr:hypothetical protein NDU88_003277 [Pleurodeles waltl]